MSVCVCICLSRGKEIVMLQYDFSPSKLSKKSLVYQS